ncbi:alpha/beta hydrolase (plasmid) [Streptomyces sp. NBC_01276]
MLRFERVLPLLTDLHVVVPALPGFPFAAPLTTSGMSSHQIAGIVAAALDELGYSRYTLSGGDVGGTVAEVLAAEYPDRVAALHLTNTAPQRALAADPAKLTPWSPGQTDRPSPRTSSSPGSAPTGSPARSAPPSPPTSSRSTFPTGSTRRPCCPSSLTTSNRSREATPRRS